MMDGAGVTNWSELQPVGQEGAVQDGTWAFSHEWEGRGRLPSRDDQLVTVRLPARLGCFGQWGGGDYPLARPRVDQMVTGGGRYVIRPLAGGGQTTCSITTSWSSPTTPWTCGFALPSRRPVVHGGGGTNCPLDLVVSRDREAAVTRWPLSDRTSWSPPDRPPARLVKISRAGGGRGNHFYPRLLRYNQLVTVLPPAGLGRFGQIERATAPSPRTRPVGHCPLAKPVALPVSGLLPPFRDLYWTAPTVLPPGRTRGETGRAVGEGSRSDDRS